MAITVAAKIAYAAVSAAISFLAAYLLAPKPPKAPLDDSKTSPSVRGTLLPIFLGHFRIMGTVGFVGNRHVVDEKIDGGGKGGGADPSQKVYYEQGWHQLSFGQGRSMVRIFQAGKSIWYGDINPTNTPSGSAVDIGTEGRFYIYWGEDTQPLCTALETAIGVGSKWPNVFYVFWDKKRLGTNPVWPALEYEISADVKKPNPVLTGDSFYEEYSLGITGKTAQAYVALGRHRTGNYYYISYANRIRILGTLPDIEVGMRIKNETLGLSGEITELSTDASYTYVTTTDSISLNMLASAPTGIGWYNITGTYDFYGWPFWGVNPAYALEQFINQPRPWGTGFSAGLFDTSLQTVQTLLDTEAIPCTSWLKSGRSWKDGIASIIQDMGIMMYFDIETGLYGFKAIREEAVSQTLTESEYDGKTLLEAYGYSVLASETRIFSFKDSARKFSDSTILAPNDAIAKFCDDPNAKRVSLETITSFPSASKVAARRDQEIEMNGVVSVDVSYAVVVRIGELIQLDALAKGYRVVSVKTDPDEAKKTLGLIEDSYSSSANFIEQGPVGLNPGNRQEVAPDLVVVVVEVNRLYAADTHGFHVLRIRANQIASSGLIYDSSAGTSYDLAGEMPSATGGLLTEALAEGTEGLVETGPQFDLLGEDYYKFQDLSTLDSDWRSGVQLCYIGSELFFLQKVTAIGGITYRLDGLIRARYGTAQEAHAIDAAVFIMPAVSLEIFSEPWLVAGVDLHVKSVPVSATSAVSIDNVVPFVVSPYNGGGYRPLQPENLTTDEDVAAWVAGTDIELRWDYKNGSSRAGAGFPLTGEASALSLPEGTFTLEFLTTGDVLKRTVDLLAVSTYTYANATLVSDFGLEPSAFKVRVVNNLNGLTSPVEETTFTKV